MVSVSLIQFEKRSCLEIVDRNIKALYTKLSFYDTFFRYKWNDQKAVMRREQLSPVFDWKRIESTDEDIASFDPLRARRILFLSYLIRDFEEHLLVLKNAGCVWGPVHSSIGQEALASAAICALGAGDLIAGSHRAHHQFLAKSYLHVAGGNWDPLVEAVPAPCATVVERTLAEIMGLRSGYCGGRGGSMHLRNIDAGVLGTNAIVGGGIPIATGAAYAQKYLKTGNVVVCFFGDGAINQGAFHEACNLAGIWKLPILYFVENNRYAVATKASDVCAVSELSQRAASYSMDARIVDGSDVAAVFAAVGEAVAGMRDGSARPCIIEAKCYRHFHHAGDQPGSVFGYREKEEEAESWRRDALATYPAALIRLGLISAEEVGSLLNSAKACVAAAVDACTLTGPKGLLVRPELWPDVAGLAVGVRSDGFELKGLPYREIEDFPGTKEMSYVQSISAVTERWMLRDATVVEFGEEIANFGGGAYGGTKGLPQKYPRQVINTPISEAGFVGLSCGAAMGGLKPIVEIMFPDFSLVAADQLFNQIGKARHMYGNTTDLPIVVRTRIAIGCGYGGQHSMDPIGLFALFPGWRIVAPGNAFDYIGLFNTAMASKDPVLILEHHSLYPTKSAIPEDDLDYCVPFGKARLLQTGTDVTVVGYGAMAGRVLALAGELSKAGVSADIIDLRTLDLPSIDYAAIDASLRKTGALVLVEEAGASMSIGPRIVAEMVSRSFDYLDGPPLCLSSRDVPNSVSRVLEEAAILGNQAIVKGIVEAALRKA